MHNLNIPVHAIRPFDGYGKYIRDLLRALAQRGDVDFRPYMAHQYEWDTFLQNAAGIDHSRLTLYIAPGSEVRLTPSRNWILTMYESTRIPSVYVSNINERCERMIAPCRWIKDVFAANGVKVPIHVVPGGVDGSHYTLLPLRPKNRPYTFMCLADRAMRKGWHIALMAFMETFREDDDVALIIKARQPDILKIFTPDAVREGVYKKVRIWCGEVDDERDIYAHADCYVFPTAAEGWGSPPREAAACGLPVLATDYSGTAEGCDQWAIPLRDYRLVDSADLPTPALPGKWARVNPQEVGHWMRWCYKHREEAQAKGLQSAAWLRANQTWEQSAQALVDLIDEIDVRRPEQARAQWEVENAQSEQDLQQFVHDLGAMEHTNGINRNRT